MGSYAKNKLSWNGFEEFQILNFDAIRMGTLYVVLLNRISD